MKIRSIDLNGDWMFGSGLQTFKKDLPAIMQNIQTRLKSWKGDSFAHIAEGVDYNNFMDIGTKALLDSDIKRVILQSEGVIKMSTYESTLNRADRGISVQTEIVTIYGSDALELEL